MIMIMIITCYVKRYVHQSTFMPATPYGRVLFLFNTRVLFLFKTSPPPIWLKKNRLVWKHCVQIQTLTSLCKNSTRNLYGIFYRPCFKSCIKRSLFFGQVALFSQTITHVMFCSLFLICPRYYDKSGKLMWRLSSKLNGCLTQIENSKWCCHFQPITVM